VWNLAKEPGHYDAIVAVMELRESLRDYVKALNDESVATGMPMMRPMMLEFPGDTVCELNATVEAQFMLGSDWLIAPVTTENASTWSAYLPALEADEGEWVYHWNGTSCGKGGAWVEVDTTNMTHFPLFERRSKA
jgi:alpha-D-xyloside xylohydrolase